MSAIGHTLNRFGSGECRWRSTPHARFKANADPKAVEIPAIGGVSGRVLVASVNESVT
ncbi:hypothetical protein D3C72_2141370 [compost metagenome]